ncbi:MAG: phosphoadenylyl-sulfate reductase [Xanthobacteraceae bacterium]
MTEEEVQSTAAELNRALVDADPAVIIAAAMRAVAPGRLAVVSSFGAETAALLKLVADADRATPVVFLDTGWLFPETLAYRDALASLFGLSDIRVHTPSTCSLGARDPDSDLWSADPDACCHIRKVVPLAEALRPFDAWINGRKRYHGRDRQRLPLVEGDGTRLKFNPLAHSSPQDIERIFAAHALPRHPLEAQGFSSIGCMPCTTRTLPGEGPRAGRWRGRGKTECGIHARPATESLGSHDVTRPMPASSD